MTFVLAAAVIGTCFIYTAKHQRDIHWADQREAHNYRIAREARLAEAKLPRA